ncbi:solute carrier family 41 member 1-like [Watersipora subatra]|uniref:solute carrier family 41 member 1-like n=1 Tax=Watersipora subatra TaxID=2589382 RepID=UPI00355BDBA4
MTVLRRRSNMVPNILDTNSQPSTSDDSNAGETDLSAPLILSSEQHDTHTGIPAAVKEESSFRIAIQVFFPFLIAGFGTVGAGMVLDIVQHWLVFKEVTEIFILVPALLGLKGNLEMTLASRLSTQVHLGVTKTRSATLSMIYGNLVLVQAQALVVGFLAAVFAMVMGWIPQGKWNIEHGFILCSSSMLTASLASLVLGLVMISVVLLSKKLGVNPDNVATPVAASLGDLTTLALLAAISKLVYMVVRAKQEWLPPLIMSLLILFIPLFIYLAYKNSYVSEVVYTGWTPIIAAMAISCVGGLVLDMTVADEKYIGMAVFQPVMNGVGGNLVAVHASRLSTGLHTRATLGTLPPDTPFICFNIFKSFFGKDMAARTSRVLLAMVVPGQIIFIYSIKFMGAGHTSITFKLVLLYNAAALIQVIVLLYICNCMVHWMWKSGDDPDNFAIPYLTAIGDLLGTSLLALCFYILYIIGDRDQDLGD